MYFNINRIYFQMGRCAVKNCKNYQGKKFMKDIRFFTFPRDQNVLNKWVSACGTKTKVHSDSRICSLHFTEEDYSLQDILLNICSKKRRLKPDAVPTKHLPEEAISKRGARLKKRKEIIERTKYYNNKNLQQQLEETIRFHEKILEAKDTYVKGSDSRIHSLKTQFQTAIQIERKTRLKSNRVPAVPTNYLTEEVIKEEPKFSDGTENYITQNEQFDETIGFYESLLDTEDAYYYKESSNLSDSLVNMCSKTAQTDIDREECNKHLELTYLRRENKVLKKKIRRLEQMVTERKSQEITTRNIFTKGQMMRIQNRYRQCQCTRKKNRKYHYIVVNKYY